MVNTCEYILSNNRYCKNYIRYSCSIKKTHKLCSVHGSMILGQYALVIQRYYHKHRLKQKVKIFNKLPSDLKVYIINKALSYVRINRVYNLISGFITNRIQVSLNTIKWYELFYTRYTDVYTYFNDSNSLDSFCSLLELVSKYFSVIKDKINLKNIKNICEELKKIYFANYTNMSSIELDNWIYVINLINRLPLVNKKVNSLTY